MNFIDYCTNLAQVIFATVVTFCVLVFGCFYMLFCGLQGCDVTETRNKLIDLIQGE